MPSIKYTEVPKEEAALIGERFNKDQVIILSFDRELSLTTVSTWGRTMHDSDQAATGGNYLKKVLGWPDHLCYAVSPKVEALKTDLNEIRGLIADNINLFGGLEKTNKIFSIIMRAQDRIIKSGY